MKNENLKKEEAASYVASSVGNKAIDEMMKNYPVKDGAKFNQEEYLKAFTKELMKANEEWFEEIGATKAQKERFYNTWFDTFNNLNK